MRPYSSSPTLLYSGHLSPDPDDRSRWSDTKRGYEDVHDRHQEHAQHRHVVDLVRLADVLLVFDVVPAVHDETHAHRDLNQTNS